MVQRMLKMMTRVVLTSSVLVWVVVEILYSIPTVVAVAISVVVMQGVEIVSEWVSVIVLVGLAASTGYTFSVKALA